jgi:hypothetical protein
VLLVAALVAAEPRRKKLQIWVCDGVGGGEEEMAHLVLKAMEAVDTKAPSW